VKRLPDEQKRNIIEWVNFSGNPFFAINKLWDFYKSNPEYDNLLKTPTGIKCYRIMFNITEDILKEKLGVYDFTETGYQTNIDLEAKNVFSSWTTKRTLYLNIDNIPFSTIFKTEPNNLYSVLAVSKTSENFIFNKKTPYIYQSEVVSKGVVPLEKLIWTKQEVGNDAVNSGKVYTIKKLMKLI
jgi:hypothetical protein